MGVHAFSFTLSFIIPLHAVHLYTTAFYPLKPCMYNLPLHSRHFENKGETGANDHQGIHQVPNVAQVRARVGDHAQVDDLSR